MGQSPTWKGLGTVHTGSRTRPWALKVGLAQVPTVVVSAVLLWSWSRPMAGSRLFTLFDDAMVSMSYARTWAETGEAVWYPGAERVQGFSNPLWTAGMAVIHRLGLQDSQAALAVSLTGLVLIVASGVMVSSIVRGLSPSGHDATALLAGATASLAFPILFWSLRGMEVGLLAMLTALLLLAVSTSLRVTKRSTLAVTSALAVLASVAGVLTRIDFVVVSGAVGAVLLLAGWRTPRIRVLGIALLTATVVAAAAVLLWQRAYFGDPLPVTYYLKVEGVSIAERILRGVANACKLLPILVVTAAAFVSVRRRLVGSDRITVDASAAVVAAVIGYQVWVGGDAWEWSMLPNRFVSVTIPLVVALVFVAVALRNDDGRAASAARALMGRGLAWLVVVSALGAGVQTNPLRYDPIRGIAFLVIIGLCVGLVVLVERSRPTMLPAAVGLSTWAAMSALPILYSIVLFGSAGPFVDFDAQTVERASTLRDSLDVPATVATVRAGADSYYTRQAVLDILGKNDSTIAHGAPHRETTAGEFSTFYPGHDKWDYGWTIDTLRPDVIMDLWVATGNDYARLEEFGYVRVCLADGSRIWATGSALADNLRLTACEG